jgi:SAM-dependent MidA family methyltransferase
MSQAPPYSAEFLAAFRARADASGAMSFARFMELALYDSAAGYYQRARPRVGFGVGTDFFTASTSGPLFGELIAASCTTLLGSHPPQDYTFVEIGAETDDGVLGKIEHPFKADRVVKLGEPLVLEGPCVIFSNELFDAQPFHRYAFRRGAWRELGVALRDGELREIELPEAPSEKFLPATAAENYVIDAPLAARQLLERIAAQPWTGLFVACDYGKTWRELAEECPTGTARAYYQHKQSSDLLARPGEQDLTCHVCWDWLANALTEQGFAAPIVESQEAFFVRYAAGFIEATTSAEAAHFSRKKLSLLQLLHPGNMGQKFQVLHARRDRTGG